MIEFRKSMKITILALYGIYDSIQISGAELFWQAKE